MFDFYVNRVHFQLVGLHFQQIRFTDPLGKAQPDSHNQSEWMENQPEP